MDTMNKSIVDLDDQELAWLKERVGKLHRGKGYHAGETPRDVIAAFHQQFNVTVSVGVIRRIKMVLDGRITLPSRARNSPPRAPDRFEDLDLERKISMVSYYLKEIKATIDDEVGLILLVCDMLNPSVQLTWR
jgi:hypothetical protein